MDYSILVCFAGFDKEQDMVDAMVKKDDPCVAGVVFQIGDSSQTQLPNGEIRYKVILIKHTVEWRIQEFP